MLNNTNIKYIKRLPSPDQVKKKYPINDKLKKIIINNRKEITDILMGKIKKFLVITGPCSIHNREE